MMSWSGLALVAAALVWHPWSHVSLQRATTVLPAATAVAPPAGRDDVLAIIWSGDGGWRDLDRQLGGIVAGQGVPVLGVSTLSYYWHGGSAEQSARELDALMDEYLVRWHKRRVWLIGFSFGADVLPTIIEHLSPANRARVAQLVLLSPSRDLNFEIELEGYMRENWLKTRLKALTEHFNPVPHYPALPPLLALQGQPPVACYYGSEERDDTVCTQAALPGWIQVHAMQGDHHLGGDYGALARRLVDGLPVERPPVPVPH
jgi:type IV secretory pathway VirJ component